MKNTKTPTKPKKLRFRRLGLLKLASLSIAVLAIGGATWVGVRENRPSHAYTGHHSECGGVNVPSTVAAGQAFNASVTMVNDGTTTWSSGFGFFFGQYNSGSGSYYNWNASGTAMPNDVAPGGSKTFNLSMTAPSTPGTYQFNWAMYIVNQPVIQVPCTGYTTTVPSPPGGFTLSPQSQTANSITLSWTTSAGASWYQVYRNNYSVADGIHGNTYPDSGLTCNTTYTYLVNAVNNAGSTRSNTINATTGACPSSGGGTPAPPIGGSGAGSSTPSSGSSGGSTTKTSAPTTKKTNPQSGAASTPLQGATNSNTDTTRPISDSSQPEVTAADNSGSPFVPSDSQTLTASQPKKHGSIFLTILKVFLVMVLLLGAIGAGLFFFVRYRSRKQLENTYDDYWHKMNGI